MDTLTHALSGALLARAILPGRLPAPSIRRATVVCTLAAAFPDIDFILRWSADSLTYLNLHRGVTHSLVLLPLWALLLSLAFRRPMKQHLSPSGLYLLCMLGLLIHICGDVITVYGTRILVPLSPWRAAWPTTFIIDLIFTGIILSGLVLSVFFQRRKTATLALTVLAGYVGFQGVMHGEAGDIARARALQLDLPPYQASVIPQPLSPLHWKLIVTGADEYEVAYVRLHGDNWFGENEQHWWSRLAAAYQDPAALTWQRIPVFSGTARERALAEDLWQLPNFDGFREFAVYPAVYRVETGSERHCFWFTDLRFVVPTLTPPFRYGLCTRDRQKEWVLERLQRGESITSPR